MKYTIDATRTMIDVTIITNFQVGMWERKYRGDAISPKTFVILFCFYLDLLKVSARFANKDGMVWLRDYRQVVVHAIVPREDMREMKVVIAFVCTMTIARMFLGLSRLPLRYPRSHDLDISAKFLKVTFPERAQEHSIKSKTK